MREQNITQSIDNLALCIFYLNEEKKINSQIAGESKKKFILDWFQKYKEIRKAYKREVIGIKEELFLLEGNFDEIISTSEILSNEQITQLLEIIIEIQYTIKKKITKKPRYYQELEERYPKNFN